MAHTLRWLLVLLLALPALGANDFSDAVSDYGFENVATDAVGTNDLNLFGGANYESSAGRFQVGSYALNVEPDGGIDCAFRADGDLSANTPGKSGTTNTVITVCAWVSPEVAPNDTQYFTIGSKYRIANGGRSWHFYLRNSGGTHLWGVAKGKTNGDAVDSTAELDPTNNAVGGQWYHTSFSIDASGNWRIQVYDLTADVTDAATGTYTGGAMTVSTTLVAVGARRIAADNGFDIPWDGQIDEFVMFGKVLTGEQMTAVQEGGYPPAGTGPTAIQKWWARRRQ